MVERTVSTPAKAANILSQLSPAALATLSVAVGNTESERIIALDDAFASELTGADPNILSPTHDDIRAEAAMRLILQFGARDRDHMERLIQDGTREAVKLLRIGAGNWTPEQVIRAATLEAAEAYVDAIDAASKALRAMQPIPVDYADDAHWPAQPAT